jgi:hypothetical protein
MKEGQKEEFSAAFQKLYDRAKACIYASGANFFFLCLRFLKKISPKTFGLHCVCRSAVNLILLPSWAVVGI